MDNLMELMTENSSMTKGEAMRVLKPTGTLLFKWNQDQIPFRLVLATIAVDGYKPILGDKRSKTRWSVFIKS